MVALNHLRSIVCQAAHTVDTNSIDAGRRHTSSLSSDGKRHQAIPLQACQEMLRIFDCSNVTEVGSFPEHSAVALARANSPQSYPLLCH